MSAGGKKRDLFPLAVIDIEASSLDPTSFPIEVGVAIAHDATAFIHVWSTIILPDPAWNAREAWDLDAERTHGISRRDLTHGMPAAATLAHLNTLLGSIPTVWCGDSKYDPFWLRKLVAAAVPLQPRFCLQGIAELTASEGHNRDHLTELLASTPTPHRAGPDAERLCRALIAWFAEPKR